MTQRPSARPLIQNRPKPEAPHAPQVFDRALVRHHRQRAADSFPQFSYLHERAMEDLLDRLSLITRDFERCLILGAHAGLEAMIEAHPARAKMGQIILADLSDQRLSGAQNLSLAMDEEHLPLKEESLDLVLSCLHLHWTNDPVGSLIQLNYALKPDGFFAGALLGGRTLTELRQAFHRVDEDLGLAASKRISPFADTMDFAQLLARAGFNMPVSDIDRVTVRFGNSFVLMRDLREMGETNALIERTKNNPGKDYFVKVAQAYSEMFAHEDRKIPATFEIIHAAAWAPHPDQPKPKRPGSAQVSLADALGTQEISTGEKAG